jgi:hypothetical protein
VNLAKTYALVFGGVYTLVGLLGLVLTPLTLATSTLIIFPVNILHNIAHLVVIGLLGLAAYFTGQAVSYCRAMAVLFLILVIGGLLPQPFLGLVPLGGVDIVLHALSGILAALAGWAVLLGLGGKSQATA